MAIEADKRYHLLHTMLSFAKNEPFLRKLKNNYPLEIPYIDYPRLSLDLKEALDTYIYIPEIPEAKAIITKLSRQYTQVVFTALGLVSGREILKLVESCQESLDRTIIIGGFYRITSGPKRNLQVQLESLEEEVATVSYELLAQRIVEQMPFAQLEIIESPLNPNAGFRNLMQEEFKLGNKNAVVIDGSFALHKAMFGYDRVYTKEKRFVGGCQGFYFELLRLKEIYPEREIHVVFDGYDEKKFTENPEYKAQRMQYRDKWYAAYEDNLEWCKKLTQLLGFHLYQLNDKEGDDVVGSLAHHLTADLGYKEVLIFSKDHDYFQMVDDKISLMVPKKSFRGHSQIVTPQVARDEFKVNRNDKINWARALAGDTSDNIKSVNQFYYDQTGTMSKYTSQHYLPIINESDTWDEFKEELIADDRFADFVHKGQLDTNFKLLTIRRDIFDPSDDLSAYRAGSFNHTAVEELLEEVAFFKEIEMLARVARIFQGIW